MQRFEEERNFLSATVNGDATGFEEVELSCPLNVSLPLRSSDGRLEPRLVQEEIL